MTLHNLDPRHGKHGGNTDPVIAVFGLDAGHYWQGYPFKGRREPHGPYAAEADALFAARCALAGIAQIVNG